MSELASTPAPSATSAPTALAPPLAAGPKRIGILLNGLEGKANTVALRFLILEMNRLQRSFEYEFLPPKEDDELLALLRTAGPIHRDSIKAQTAVFHQRYSTHLSDLNREYLLKEAPPDHFVVVCLTTLDDNYYSTRKDRVAVIALGNWERHMAPPSIVEFLLVLIVREAVASVSRLLSGSVHLGTKGCLFDFTSQLEDARFKVLNAHVCHFCAAALAADQHPHLADEIRFVLGKKWLGQASRPGTPAALSAKLGHDLFATKGLQPTLWEQLLKVLREEGPKQGLTLAGAMVAAAVLTWLGLKP